MSHKQNDTWLEDMKIRFEQAVAEQDWCEVDTILMELSENGFGKEEIALSYEIEDEDYTAFKKRQSDEDLAVEQAIEDMRDNKN